MTAKILIAIPCLNEEDTIESTIDTVRAALRDFPDAALVIIDDGCTDSTAELASSKGATILTHGYNRGVGVAFRSAVGYFLANEFDILVSIDADGQFDPGDIPRLIEPIIKEEADFVSGSRFSDPLNRPRMPLIKYWGNQGMSVLISRLAGHKFDDVSCGFRAYSYRALLNLNLHGEFTYTQETFLNFANKGLIITEVPVKVTYFPDRTSRVAHNLFQYAYKTSLIIFRAYRDYNPLSFFWGLAFMHLLVGAGFGAFFWHHFFTTGRFSPHIWAGFITAFLLIVGMLLFFVGLITDTLARMRVNQERILYNLRRMARK